jgi:hypothetical protein
MRRALDFVTQFIGSGHVDTEKIIGVERREPQRYMVPIHEFLRSLLHSDGVYYDPHKSPIANVFAIDQPETKNHFLICLALEYVLSKGDAKDSAGYIGLSDVYQYLQGLGYSVESIAFAVGYMARFRLIEAPMSDADVTRAEKIRITTVGAYTLQHLPGMFTYCDAVIVDTPILDAETRIHTNDAHTLADRLSRVELFRQYIGGCWESSGLSDTGWSWPAVSQVLADDVTKVQGKAS